MLYVYTYKYITVYSTSGLMCSTCAYILYIDYLCLTSYNVYLLVCIYHVLYVYIHVCRCYRRSGKMEVASTIELRPYRKAESLPTFDPPPINLASKFYLCTCM